MMRPGDSSRVRLMQLFCGSGEVNLNFARIPESPDGHRNHRIAFKRVAKVDKLSKLKRLREKENEKERDTHAVLCWRFCFTDAWQLNKRRTRVFCLIGSAASKLLNCFEVAKQRHFSHQLNLHGIRLKNPFSIGWVRCAPTNQQVTIAIRLSGGIGTF